VYRELFQGSDHVILVDSDGVERVCAVVSEMRNDMRLQHTLGHSFPEYWDTAGVRAGDVLTFHPEPAAAGASPRMRVARHAVGPEANAAMASAVALGARAGSSALAGDGAEWAPLPRGRPRAERPAPATSRGGGGAGGASAGASHPNRWSESADGSATKTVYRSTLVHQQLPIAGWLFRKLYDRLPGEADVAPMRDPDLGADYQFEVSYVAAANIHYITGRAFGAWIRDSGLRSGERIKLARGEDGTVLLQRVAPETGVPMQVTATAGRPVRTARPVLGAALATLANASGAPPASPWGAGELGALETLAAAAVIARTHGTPGINAALGLGRGWAGLGFGSGALGSGAAVASAAARPSLSSQDMEERGVAPVEATGSGDVDMAASGGDGGSCMDEDAAPRPSCIAESPGAAAAALLPLAPKRQRTGPAPALVGAAVPWQPASRGAIAFSTVAEVLNGHQWTTEEQAALLHFRIKFGESFSCTHCLLQRAVGMDWALCQHIFYASYTSTEGTANTDS
jgi:hypothetical protein